MTVKIINMSKDALANDVLTLSNGETLRLKYYKLDCDEYIEVRENEDILKFITINKFPTPGRVYKAEFKVFNQSTRDTRFSEFEISKSQYYKTDKRYFYRILINLLFN